MRWEWLSFDDLSLEKLYEVLRVRQEVFAETSLDSVSISVVYPGATPSEVEQSVIQKILLE